MSGRDRGMSMKRGWVERKDESKAIIVEKVGMPGEWQLKHF